MNLQGLVDLHVHTAPDVRARSCDDFQLAREAQRTGARAVVIKSHHVPTVDRAWLARQAVPGAQIFGGVTLNESVGGLNPAAVDVALRLGARIVWLPTLSALEHRRQERKAGGVGVVADGRVVPAAREIFRQVAAANAILATGHQSAAEVRVVVAAAWAEGVEKILVNHPEHRVVGMDVAAQRELLRDFPVYFERCYAQPGGPGAGYLSNAEANLRAIEALGPESTVLASDVGQIENPPWAECWERTFEYLGRHGVGDAALRQMAGENPGRLLGV
jgi:hypothetical protein